MRELAAQLRGATSLLFFARGANYATALEAALKVGLLLFSVAEGGLHGFFYELLSLLAALDRAAKGEKRFISLSSPHALPHLNPPRPSKTRPTTKPSSSLKNPSKNHRR
jgi:hypothetical protein